MPDKNKKNHLSSKDLIDIKAWQKMQDNFSAITDISLRTLDAKGALLTLISRQPRLCSKLLEDSALKDKLCGTCLPTFLGGKGMVNKNLSFVCEAGICNFLVPLKVEDITFGYFILGPIILVMRKAKEEYRQTAEKLNIELDEFWGAILEIKVVSFQGVQSLVELIRGVGEYIIKLAYQNITKEGGVAMAPDSAKLSRLLNVLLDVAFQVTGADIGSIMFLDKINDALTIRASKGIPDEIVGNTTVRLGDGIAGIAAKERKSFLIDDNLRDNRIKSYLRRPYLSSSMVLPIEINDEVLGVVNLGALTTSSVRFNKNNMQLVNRLIDLATIALHE